MKKKSLKLNNSFEIQKESDSFNSDGNLFEKRKEITKEVEYLKRNLTQQVIKK